MTDERTHEQQLIDEQIEKASEDIMDAMTVLSDLDRYADHQYAMIFAYLNRRLEEFAHDVENRREVRNLNPDEEACEEVSAKKVLEQLQNELQTAD